MMRYRRSTANQVHGAFYHHRDTNLILNARAQDEYAHVRNAAEVLSSPYLAYVGWRPLDRLLVASSNGREQVCMGVQ